MIRAIFELLIFTLIIVVARVLLATVLKGISRASSNSSFQTQAADPHTGPRSKASSAGPGAQAGGELHKDPVCGTYVAESTAFRRQSAGQTFYYCSANCREKHALVAR